MSACCDRVLFVANREPSLQSISVVSGIGAQCELTDEESCSIGCIGAGWGNGSQCISTYDTVRRSARWTAEMGRGVRLPAGFPCADYEGYCDQENECISVQVRGNQWL